MANNVKFSTGLEEDLLKLNSDKTYVHKIDNGHVYFATKVDDDGNVIGSIYYDVDGNRVSMGGGVAEKAKADDIGNNIADTYVARISSEGEKYASTDGVTLTTYNGKNGALDTILLPVAGANRAGVVITGAQTFAGKKTFTGQVVINNATDVAKTKANSGALIIGDPAAEHIAIDGNEIMAKKTGTTTRILLFQNDGGESKFGGNILPVSDKQISLGSETLQWKNAYISNIVADTLSGHLTGSLTGNVTGNVTGHASLDLPLAGGTMTGNIQFEDVSSTKYPAKSTGLLWSGGEDSASIYFQVDKANNGYLYIDASDGIKFANDGAAYYALDSNGTFYPITNDSGSIGTVNNKFAAIYATNFYGIIERAYADESGNNIQASYGAALQAHTHDGNGWSFRLLNKNGGALTETLTVPGASVDKAGLITTGTQTFSGDKTFTGRIHFSNTTDATKSSDSGVITIGTKTGEHMLLDTNEIMVKGNATTSAILHLQAEGGSIETGGSFIPKSNKTLNLGSSANAWKNGYISNIVADTLSGHLTGSLTGNVTGNATSATKLQTARKISLGNDLQGSVSFDGTKDVTISASSYSVECTGKGTRNFPWHRIATTEGNTNADKDMVIAIRHRYNGGGYGIAKVSIRNNGTSSAGTCSVSWIVRYGISADALQVGFVSTAGSVVGDLFYKVSTWPRATIYQLQGGRAWTLITSTEASDTTATDPTTSVECYKSIAEAGTALGRSYTDTIAAKDQGIVSKAFGDEEGNNIISTYLASIQQVTSDKDTFTFRGYNKKNEAKNNLITIPAANATGTDATKWKAGLVTSQAQTWAGNKTFTGDIIISHECSETMTASSKNPHIKFQNADGSQYGYLMFTSYDTYRAPAGLKLFGTNSTNPFWVEIDGDLFVNKNATIKGNMTLTGHILPSANDTYTIGNNEYKWKEVHTTTAYVNEILYVNRSADVTKGGIGLYSTSAPTDYGIAMRNNLGVHGYATDSWNTYFSMTGGTTRGWIFRNGGTAIASINGQGKMVLNHSLTSPSVGKDVYISYPDGGAYTTTTATCTGYLKITLPQSWTSTMMRFIVSVYDYRSNTSVQYLIGGYNYSTDSIWKNVYAQCLGDWATPTLSNLTVRFGHDGTKCAIYIGEATTTWKYPQIAISNIIVGYKNYEHSKWSSDWALGFTTTLGIISATVENPHIAYRSYHADRATGDESGANIKANYLARIRQYESTGTTFKFTGVNKNGADMADLISVPAASTTIAGLVTTADQSWKGHKTFTNDITISHATDTTMTAESTNPYLRFTSGSSTDPQYVYLMYTNKDSYRTPAGLKILGGSNATPAWLEVEGKLIVGSSSTFGGNMTITGNIMPSVDADKANAKGYVIGELEHKWLDIYAQEMHIYDTLYVNSRASGSSGGISFYGTNAPTERGIVYGNTYGTHGYATDAWNMFFNVGNGVKRGWIFRNEGIASASISGEGYISANRLCLNRGVSSDKSANTKNGRISWHSPDYHTWYTYMSDSGSGLAPNGGQPATLGTVTSWAMRSLVAKLEGRGWMWESAPNEAAASTTTKPTAIMALDANTGKLYVSNDVNIIIDGENDRFVHYLYDKTAAKPIGASWRAGVLGTGSSNKNYYVIQSGTSSTASTEWINAVRIGQNSLDFTVGTTTLGGIGLANTSLTSGNGISLYGGAPEGTTTAKSGKPTFGLFHGGTSTFKTYGGVSGDRATYFTMDATTGRGWVFLSGETPIASISNTGITKVGDSSDATAVDTGALRVAGGLSTTHQSYFGHDVTFKGKILNFHGTKSTNSMIRFIDNTTNTNGNGISIGGGGVTIIGGGEAAANFESSTSVTTKKLYLLSDTSIEFYTDCQNARVGVFLDATRNLYPNEDDTGMLGLSTNRWNFLYIGTGGIESTGVVKFKNGAAATAINTGAVQITGGLSATAASYINGNLTINNTLQSTTTLYIASASGSSTIFRTNTTERMRINPSGMVNINSSSTQSTYRLYVNGKAAMALTGSGWYLMDSTGYNYPGVYDNGTNLWIGSTESATKHHTGGTYISTGHNGTSGNTTIKIVVPNTANTGAAATYDLVHSGNFTDILNATYVNVSGDTMTGTLKLPSLYATTGVYIDRTASGGGVYLRNKEVQYGRLYVNTVGTVGDGSAAVTGVAMLILGNSTANSTATDAGDNNARGAIRLYGAGANYTTIYAQGNGNRTLYLPNYGGTMYLVHAGGNAAVGDSTTPVYIAANGRVTACASYTTALDGRYVNVTGDTMSGNLTVSKASGTTSLTTTRTDTGASVSFMVGSGGTNRGVYDNNLSKWIIYSDGAAARTQLQLYGAVWNDYAEFRQTEDKIEPGRVVIETGRGDLKLSTRRLQPGANVVSDTFGFAIGETQKAKTPLAVAGRVLVYTYEDRYSFIAGDAVCTGPNGTVSKMTRQEIMMYPERIVGTVSEIPDYEIWGEENVPVNGRIWIKVK